MGVLLAPPHVGIQGPRCPLFVPLPLVPFSLRWWFHVSTWLGCPTSCSTKYSQVLPGRRFLDVVHIYNQGGDFGDWSGPHLIS